MQSQDNCRNYCRDNTQDKPIVSVARCQGNYPGLKTTGAAPQGYGAGNMVAHSFYC